MTTDHRHEGLTMKWLYFILFTGTVWAANWALTTFGILDVAGFHVPAGVLFAGLAFTLRDLLQRAAGLPLTALAVLVGASLAWWFGATPAIAIASASAFAASELVDLAVFTAIDRRKRFLLAMIVSNVAGLLVDSVVFLWLAFGSLDFLAGQVVGKVAMTAVAVPIVWAVRRRQDQTAPSPEFVTV